jgi:hypothetical protein
MDDAVWDYGSELPRTWEELRYPPGHPYFGLEKDSIDMAFALTFEEVTHGSIHGYKFKDLNGNGIDDDEPRLRGVEIQLRDADVLPSYVETWDAGPGDWQYWVEDETVPVRGGKNHPVDWSSTGGYDNSGYISTPLDELFVTFDAFWPAYMAPPDPVDPVDLNDKTVRVRVSDFGTSGLPDDSLRLFIGEWDVNDNYVFYAHNTPIPIGDDWDTLTMFDIGDDSNWTLIEDGGLGKDPSDLYVNPQQWGFTLLGLVDPAPVPQLTGTLAFDELRITDEIIATTLTDEDGEYAFEPLEPIRSYLVTETPPAGMLQTTENPAPIFLDEGYEWVASQEQADELIAQGMDPRKVVIYPPLAFGNQVPSEIEIDVFPNTVAQLLVELPPAPGIVTNKPDLPPTDGVYRSPSDVHAQYTGADLNIVLQDLQHRPFADPPPTIVNVGSDEHETFQSSLLGNAAVTSDALGLEGELVQMELAGPVQTIVTGKANSAVGSFMAEIVEMTLMGDISNGPQIVIREDPTQASVGQTTITDLGGGLYHIDSFFDVFTELSVDGGSSWIAAAEPVRMELVQPGIVARSPDLPPTDGVYQSPQQVHAKFSGPELEILLQDIVHQPFAGGIERFAVGPNEVETFESSMTGIAIATIPRMGLDGTPLAVELTGPVVTVVSDKVGNMTGDFQAEIVSMTLSGEVVAPGGEIIAMVIQESPTLASVGRTTINDRGNGEFPVESFFDVFVEMSVDGGQSWIAASDSVRVELRPRPKLLPLTGPTEVWVFFEGGTGAAQDDDRVPDGRDEVRTEIVSMDLKGMTPAGPIEASVRADRPSVGEIEERVQSEPGTLDVDPFTANATADSFFDVWAEITVGGQRLVTDRPLRIETIIDHKPPRDGERYVNPYLTRVELIDPITGQGTGIFVLREIHQPDPTTEVDLFPQTSALVALVGGPIGAAPVPFILHGPAEAHVFFEGPTHGDAVDDDGNALDEVVTQLVSMNLTDGNVTLRIRDVTKSPYSPSLGQIEELVNNNPGRLDLDPFHPGNAQSFFDVLFEIELPDGTILHNEQPLRIGAVISEKPPFARYVHIIPPGGPVKLYDEANEVTDVAIVRAEHHTGTVEVDTFPETVGHLLIERPGPIITPDPNLPPLDGVYRSPQEVHAVYEGPELTVVLQDLRHRPFADPPPQITAVGQDEMEVFQSVAKGTAMITQAGIELPPIPIELTGPVETRVQNKADQTTGDFQAEIVSMTLSGDITLPDGTVMPVVLRESLTLASAGQTVIDEYQVGGAGGEDQWTVDSFFDVFTELSVDGGDNWIASTDKVRMQLVQPLLVNLVGPAEVHVDFEGAVEGMADDDDNDGLDEVDTELVSMDLRGHAPAGPVQVTLRQDVSSLGQIVERANLQPGTLDVAPFTTVANLPADSFFDVWTEIRIGQQVYHTAAPLPIEALISHKPPQDGERYVNPFLRPVELIDPVTGQGTGIFVVREVHQPDPTVEHDVFPLTSAEVELDVPGLGPIRVNMSGPSSVDVFFEGPVEGDAVDDDFNGLDEVATRMTALDLAGFHPAVGDVYLRLNTGEVSLGQIEENSNTLSGNLDLPPFAAAGTASSFFDVFFEIEIPSQSLTLHNERPLRMQSRITYKPPGLGDEYVNPWGPIELFDENGQQVDIVLTDCIHVPNPRPDVPDNLGMYNEGVFYLDTTGNGTWDGVSGGDTLRDFGISAIRETALPVTGDWDGNGTDDLGLYNDGMFYLDTTGNGTWDRVAGGDTLRDFGISSIRATAKPVIGDWDGNGTDDLGLYNDGMFYLDTTGNGTWDRVAGGDTLRDFGINAIRETALPVIGDWDGDAADDLGLYNAECFYLDTTGNGVWDGVAGGDTFRDFGINAIRNTAQPVIGDWDGDADDDLGVHDEGYFYLDTTGNGVWDKVSGGDAFYDYGINAIRSTGLPLAGRWAPPLPPVVASLLAAGSPAIADATVTDLTEEQLLPVLDQALALWAAADDRATGRAAGLGNGGGSAIGGLAIQIADLPGAALGMTNTTSITIDINAAGYGWFVDPTPDRHEEFLVSGNSRQWNARPEGPAESRMDLLTAVMHELGHELGYGHEEDGLMDETLSPGVRRGLNPAAFDEVFAELER